MNSIGEPGAFILGRNLRYESGTPDVIDKYIFQADLREGFHVHFQGAGLRGDMSFSNSALESGLGLAGMSQGAVYSSNNEYIDVESTTIDEDTPPFLISRKLFSELKSKGKTDLQYGNLVEISVRERSSQQILVDDTLLEVPVYRCTGSVDIFDGESANFELVVVDDPQWPVVLSVGYGRLDSDFIVFCRFEEAREDLQLEASND